MKRFPAGRLGIVLLVLLGGGLLACGPSPSDQSYEDEVLQDRMHRDMRMRKKGSVIPPGRREAFQGLDFYQVDPRYRFVVPLRRLSSPDTLMVAESTGGVRAQVHVGRVTIPLPDGDTELWVFKGASEGRRGRLWIPFSDSTNGHTTYEGGRYVDLQPVGSDSVVVDFNRAYNPTCAYNPDFACPLPPPENRIDAPIPAGEKQPLFQRGTGA